MNNMQPLLLDTRRAAESLGISPRYLQSLVADRAIPHVRLGRRVLFDPQDLAAWIAANKQPAEG